MPRARWIQYPCSAYGSPIPYPISISDIIRDCCESQVGIFVCGTETAIEKSVEMALCYSFITETSFNISPINAVLYANPEPLLCSQIVTPPSTAIALRMTSPHS